MPAEAESRGALGPGGSDALKHKPPVVPSGDYMATVTETAPSREDFAAMLEQSFDQGNLQEGSVIKGTVVGIEKDLAVIDVGLKTEGRVALREFAGPGRNAEIKIGDTVEVYLERVENALGEAVLSRDKARREESWGKLEKAFQNNEKVTGVIFNQVKGGFTVDLDGAVAFLPRSQVDIRPIRDVGPLMNQQQPFQILKMDRRRGNIVVSRRTVLEESRAEQRQELVQNLEEGQVIDGVVKNITDYGAFVDLGGIDGLLHVTDMAWRRVNHPSEVLNIGDTVKVQIIRINRETQRISLGMKQLEADPWEGAAGKYPVGGKFSGRVTNITEYGAFVELEPGIEGLVHVSEMSWTKKNVHPGKIVSTSQEVDVAVLEVDVEKERISLGMKQLERGGVAKGASSGGGVSKNDIVTVTVLEVRDGGLEVQVGDDGATGFLKRTDLGRDRDEQRPERFQVGQKFDAQVIGFDRSKKPNFSVKALQIAEEKQAVAQYGSSDSGASLGDILGEALKQAKKE